MERTLQRLRSEFLEMPGMRLTAAQTQRLCGIDEGLCMAVLDALVDARFLRRNADGSYARATDGPAPRFPAVAMLRSRPVARAS
jgi:hypothetical protein